MRGVLRVVRLLCHNGLWELIGWFVLLYLSTLMYKSRNLMTVSDLCQMSALSRLEHFQRSYESFMRRIFWKILQTIVSDEEDRQAFRFK